MGKRGAAGGQGVGSRQAAGRSSDSQRARGAACGRGGQGGVTTRDTRGGERLPAVSLQQGGAGDRGAQLLSTARSGDRREVCRQISEAQSRDRRRFWRVGEGPGD